MSLTALGFLAIYSIGLFLALFRHPLFGLATYLWAFYMAPPSQWWGVYLPNWRWSLCAAIVTFIATLRLERPVFRPAWHASWGIRFLIAYVAWTWLQNAWAVDQEHGELFFDLHNSLLGSASELWVIHNQVFCISNEGSS